MPLRFSIRDLLWLTLVVALVVGWWLDHSHIKDKLDSAEDQVKNMWSPNFAAPF